MAKKATIEIEFTGSRAARRLMSGYVWDEDNNFITAVDIETAAELLTYPRPGQWAPAAGQKVSQATIKRLASAIGIEPAAVEALITEVND